MTAKLLVTIDTEEEFDWSAPVSPENRGVAHVAGLPRLQELFDELGVRATYLVDYPVVTTDKSARVLSEIVNHHHCEIGAHVHPWVNPPITEEIRPRNTYLCNLPLGLQQEKLGRLTDAIEETLGRRPTSFRAGRYGIDFRLVPYMGSLGYTVDSSVIAYQDFSSDAGPCFAEFGDEPFWLEPPLVPKTNGGRPLLEVPCTVGFSRRPFALWSRLHDRLSRGRLRRLRLIGVMWHLRIVRKTVLTPEGTETGDLIRLLRVLRKDRDAVLTVSFHSPSVVPGNTPYVRTKDDERAFFDRLRSMLSFALHQLGARSMTLSEFSHWFSGSTRE